MADIGVQPITWHDLPMSIRLIQTVVLLLVGGFYWETAVWVTGAKEPWDAPTYWDTWYPCSLLLSACVGPFLKQGPWQAGLLLTFSQLPVMAWNSEPGPLLVVGLMYLSALAIPAMMLSQLTGWIKALATDLYQARRHDNRQSRSGGLSLMAIRLHNSFALHPGPWLRRNFIEPYGLTQSDAAKRLGVTRVALSNLLNGKSALSPEMAIRFEMAFGVSAKTLLRMQSAHDLARAQSAAKTIKVNRIDPPKRGAMAA